MSDVQYRVVSDINLVMRADGYREALAVAAVTPFTIVHVTGAPNAAGYVPAYVFGWLDTDGRTLRDDLLSRGPHFDALLYVPARFNPIGAQDVYGRQPGEIHGWLAAKYLKQIEPETVL